MALTAWGPYRAWTVERACLASHGLRSRHQRALLHAKVQDKGLKMTEKT